MSIKKQILDEIDKRIARKKQIRKEVAARHDDIDSYVLKLMAEVEDAMNKMVNTSLFDVVLPGYVKSLEASIRTLDTYATVEVKWYTPPDGSPKKLEGVLIRWTPEYQSKTGCDPERYVDVLQLLLK